MGEYSSDYREVPERRIVKNDPDPHALVQCVCVLSKYLVLQCRVHLRVLILFRVSLFVVFEGPWTRTLKAIDYRLGAVMTPHTVAECSDASHVYAGRCRKGREQLELEFDPLHFACGRMLLLAPPDWLRGFLKGCRGGGGEGMRLRLCALWGRKAPSTGLRVGIPGLIGVFICTQTGLSHNIILSRVIL